MRFCPRITRRRFLVCSGLAAASAVGVGLYTWRIEPHWVQLVKRDLPIKNLPTALDGRTLVQISDLHVGRSVDSSYLISAMKWVSSLEPDIVVITGDFMTCRAFEQIDAVPQVLNHLSVGRLGNFAVLGNHDYALNWFHADVADKLVQRLTELGIRVLRNEMFDVTGLQLVGIDDFWGPNFEPELTVPKVNWNEPALTLCHNPDAVDQPSMAAIRGWILSGHTHGGQCKPPFLPPPKLPVVNKRYTSGEFDVGNGRRLYINRGLGHLLRVRFNVRPEITVFRMRTV